jgi:RND family efflux transporter MFP subunit
MNTTSLFCLLVIGLVAPVFGQTDYFPGYADSLRRADVATTESGTIVEVFVTEGDFVQQGQPLLRLDDAVHQAQLAIAQHEAQNTTEIQVQESRVRLLGFAVHKLRELVSSGSARPLELEREEAELAMAKATLEYKRHEYQTKQLHLERLRIEVEKRTIRAPFSGYVAKLPRQVGEYLSLQSPDVATLIDTTLLQADFAVPFSASKDYRNQQSVELLVDGLSVQGNVCLVGLIVDRSSQTVNVRVKIDNTQHLIKPGTDCLLTAPNHGPMFLQTSSPRQP